MKYILRKLFSKRYKKRYNPKPSWADYNQLQAQVFKLESKLTSLARSNGMVHVKGVYMTEKEATKHTASGNGFICH